ncbi:MAG: FHIPEP family type III secretion protein [Clostridia bacterium]|nr:FHIPEP family type III secretion protein [Clostridia bacterium]
MQNDIPDIGREYIEFLKEKKQATSSNILMYGSTVYGMVSHDLDISFIVRSFNQEEYEKIRERTIEFQTSHNMELDQEVPYSSKLVYTDSDVEFMLKNTPFQRVNGIYVISPIEKTPEFLSSKEMKYRLLLNILTTRSILLQGDKAKIEAYKQKAWDLLVQVIISYNQLSEIDIDHFLKLLYRDEKSNQEGEMFLGYKTNIRQKQLDLEEDCERTLERLAKEGKIKKQSSRKFSINEQWER